MAHASGAGENFSMLARRAIDASRAIIVANRGAYVARGPALDRDRGERVRRPWMWPMSLRLSRGGLSLGASSLSSTTCGAAGSSGTSLALAGYPATIPQW